MSWALRKLSEPSTTLSTASPWRVRREPRACSVTGQLCQVGGGCCGCAREVAPARGDGRTGEAGQDVEREAQGDDGHAGPHRRELKGQEQTAVRGRDREDNGQDGGG